MVMPGDTWAGVLLDGLVGGVIGGAATGAAVWWTLRSGRSDERMRLTQAVASRLGATATLLAQEFSVAHLRDEDRNLLMWDEVRNLRALYFELWARLVDDFPGAAKRLDKAHDGVKAGWAQLGDPETIRNESVVALGDLSAVCMSWISDPSQFEEVKRRRFMPPLQGTRRRRR